MRPERPDLNRKVHGDRGCVPSRGRKPLERRVRGGRLVQVERLRIEFRREPLDIFTRDRRLTAPEAHPDLQIIEPFDHAVLSRLWRTKRGTGFKALTPGSIP